jgi:hypothetical protein
VQTELVYLYENLFRLRNELDSGKTKWSLQRCNYLERESFNEISLENDNDKKRRIKLLKWEKGERGWRRKKTFNTFLRRTYFYSRGKKKLFFLPSLEICSSCDQVGECPNEAVGRRPGMPDFSWYMIPKTGNNEPN